MKSCYLFLHIVFLLLSLSNVWGLPLGDEDFNGLSSEHDLFLPEVEQAKQNFAVKNKSKYLPKNVILEDDLFTRNLDSADEIDKKNASEQRLAGKKSLEDNSDFYLFDQKELDAQQEGLDIYKTLAPMLSSEGKKEAKKLWESSHDLRAAFKSSESETETLILKKASLEVNQYKGKALEELSAKNLPARLTEAKDPDQEVVHELFERFFDLLKRAFVIIITVLLSVKLISLLIKKLLKRRRKRRHSRRYSRKRSKPRRRRRVRV